MRFGCCIAGAEDIGAVRAAGYDYFEFSGARLAALTEEEAAALCAEAERQGLACLGLNSYSAGSPAMVGREFSPEAARRYAELLCRRGAALGVRRIGIGAPAARRRPADLPQETALAQFRAFLEETASVTERYGIALMLEAVHSGMCNVVNTTAEAVALLERMAPSPVGLVLDFYHMEVMGESLASVALAAPYLMHTHVSTWGEGLFRDFPGEEDRAKYAAVFAALRAVGYDGTMSVEPSRFAPEAAARSLRMLQGALSDGTGDEAN